jgi:phage shock protein PspC (stress-responsive transcriptional regulator)
MKKTLTINLNGQVFNIDADAYNLLEAYLKSLQNYFRKEQGQDEIISDFESRIEEILSQKISKGTSNVISIADVENVIKLVGNPSDFGEENKGESTDNQHFNPEQKPAGNSQRRNKKLYRNPNDKMLGGVCSGLATFFGLDVTIVRIILLILVIFWGASIWLYIILWLLVPEAKTAEQQLEMTGEAINLENIGKVLSDNAKSIGNDVKTVYQKVDNSGCLSTFLKVCAIAFGILVGIPILFALTITIFVLLAVLFGISTGFLGDYMSYTPDTISLFQHPTIAAISGCLLAGIPLISILYAIVSAIFKWKPVSKWVKVCGLVLWLGSFVLLGFAGIKWSELKNKDPHNWHIGFTRGSFAYDVTGDGNIITQTKTFSGLIDEIEIHNSIKIDLQIDSIAGNTAGLTIDGDSNILEYINIFQQGNKLVFKTKTHDTNLQQSRIYPVKLQTNNLKKVDLAGASHINLNSKLKTNDFEIEMSGASNFNASDIQADNITIDMSGASKAKLTGKAGKAEIDLSGASNLSAFGLACKNADVDISGASRLECDVEKHLSGEASGASHVIYLELPKTLTLKCTGASSMRKK